MSTQKEITAIPYFNVRQRNAGHWDIGDDQGRIFRIRGGPSKYLVMDERTPSKEPMKFKTVGACMGYICDELMTELIVAEGQIPQVIESWNV